MSCKDYDCALDKLSNTIVTGPVYYILAGISGNSGAVISRNRFNVANIATLNEENWYLLQTNQDQWSGDCPIRCN